MAWQQLGNIFISREAGFRERGERQRRSRDVLRRAGRDTCLKPRRDAAHRGREATCLSAPAFVVAPKALETEQLALSSPMVPQRICRAPRALDTRPLKADLLA
jgi:hypothetical protein